MEKRKLKSTKGFTMTDLIVAMVLIMIFVGTIGAFLYNSYKTNLQVRLTGAATVYAMKILEDIDKISYESVTEGMESGYITSLSIPQAYTLSIDVSNYVENEVESTTKKQVLLNISYDNLGKNEEIVINKIKYKEGV